MSTTNPVPDSPAADETEAKSASSSFVSKMDALLERIVDRANPILVKEVRQAMKGRGFIGTFLLVVIVCWIISVIGALNAGSALEYYDWAQSFFCWFFLPLTFAIGLVVPFLAYTSMQNERLDDTFEMLSITTLTARRIVNGKLTNAMMLILLCFSGIAPFIAFTSLLQGFRFSPVLLAMILSVLLSIGLCVLAIFISTLSRKSRLVQALLSLGLIFALLTVCSMVQFLFYPDFWTMQLGLEGWVAFGIVCLTIVCVTFLLREMSIAQITFESDNRATGVRFVASIICALTLIGLTIFFYWPSIMGTVAIPGFARLSLLRGSVTPLMVLVFAVGYFSCTEPPGLSRRVQKQVQPYNPLFKFIFNPWLPGCFRGYLYVVLHLAAMLVFAFVITNNTTFTTTSPRPYPFSSPGIQDATFRYFVVIALYGFVYAGFGAALSSALHTRYGKGMNSTLVRAAFVAVIGGLAVTPHLVSMVISEFGTGRPIGYTVGFVTSPLATLWELESENGTDGQVTSSLMLLGVAAGLLFFFNLKGIGSSFMETKKREQPSTPDAIQDSSPLKPEAL